MKFLREHKFVNHTNIYITGLFFIAAGMPLSRFLISTGQIILFLNWIIEGNFNSKWNEFKKNNTALILTLFFIVHIIGMFYTDDLSYGIQNLKIKLPLLVMPLVISTSQTLSTKIFKSLLVVFVLAAFIASLICFWIYMGMTDLVIRDNRDISIIISNIHFSLMVALSFFILIYLKSKNTYAVLIIAASLWLIIFLFILGSITGILGFIFAIFAISTFYLSQKIGKFKTVSLLFFFVMAFCGSGLIFFKKIFFINPNEISNLEKYTPLGNEYFHDITNPQRENNHLVWINISWNELQSSWEEKTKTPFNNTTGNNTELKYVLVRYLASKGLKKDRDGINQLTKEDIFNIKNGITNFKHKDTIHLIQRYYQIVWEFQSYFSSEFHAGHSVTQRFVYWKAAWSLIKKNPLFGVGTGNVKIAFNKFYEKEMPFIPEKWRYKSHNQFLTTTVALGIPGLIILILSLSAPFLKNKMYKHKLYLPFFIIFLVSIIPEDGLETQVGIAFYTFFNSLFMFGEKNLDNGM